MKKKFNNLFKSAQWELHKQCQFQMLILNNFILENEEKIRVENSFFIINMNFQLFGLQYLFPSFTFKRIHCYKEWISWQGVLNGWILLHSILSGSSVKTKGLVLKAFNISINWFLLMRNQCHQVCFRETGRENEMKKMSSEL